MSLPHLTLTVIGMSSLFKAISWTSKCSQYLSCLSISHTLARERTMNICSDNGPHPHRWKRDQARGQACASCRSGGGVGDHSFDSGGGAPHICNESKLHTLSTNQQTELVAAEVVTEHRLVLHQHGYVQPHTPTTHENISRSFSIVLQFRCHVRVRILELRFYLV